MAVAPRKAAVNCSGLANAWDGYAAIRDYLRDGGGVNVLFPDNTQVCVKAVSASHIYHTMHEICERVAMVSQQPQPSVGPLRDELIRLYKKAGRTSDLDKIVIDDSWYIRKFFSLIKMKTRKRLVSTAPRRKLNKQ